MGTASKVISVGLRLFEITCAAIVLGIISRFTHLVILGDGHVEGKLIYGEVWAALSILFAVVLIVPLMYSFYAFALDLIMFIGWMVAFGLLANLTSGHACSSAWISGYWGFYWGRFWRIPPSNVSPAIVGSAGCSEWRTILAFAFIGGLTWLGSTFLGIYVVANHRDKKHQLPEDEKAQHIHPGNGRESHETGLTAEQPLSTTQQPLSNV